jgi:hypothetical protein
MQNRIFEICNELAKQGVKPTLERVRSELGGGSFSTINPILKQWKDGTKESIGTANIELPSDISSIGLKATAMIWKIANEHCSDLITGIRRETEHLISQATTERDEALNEIKRLESDNDSLVAEVARLNVQLDKERNETKRANELASELKGRLGAFEEIAKKPTRTVKAKNSETL